LILGEASEDFIGGTPASFLQDAASSEIMKSNSEIFGVFIW
jgi:hypothetical protein